MCPHPLSRYLPTLMSSVFALSLSTGPITALAQTPECQPPASNSSPGAMPPPWMALDALSDLQQDRLLELRLAFMRTTYPLIREACRVRAALHRLSLAERFDETRAQAFADTTAHLQATIELHRSKFDHDAMALLDPVQRAVLGQHGHESRPLHDLPRPVHDCREPAPPAP